MKSSRHIAHQEKTQYMRDTCSVCGCSSLKRLLTDLKLKAMIRDQILYGIYDKRTRERLLRDPQLTLEEAARQCHASELAQQHAKTFSETGITAGHDSAKVAVVKNKMKRTTPQKKGTDDTSYSCKRCGGRHEPRQCPAYGKKCSKCNGKDHLQNSVPLKVNPNQCDWWKKLT